MGTISTAIPSPEYQPLLDAILAAADICKQPGQPPEAEDAQRVGAFALVVLSRWMANAQAFVLLRNAGFLADAYGVARIGTELAIMSAWAWGGGAGADRFKTPADRVKALMQADTYGTKVWFDKMNERGSPRGYDDTTAWGRALKAATRPAGLPKLYQMANYAEITKDMYVFAYRGESGSVHSSARVLASNAAGEPPISESLMLHNVLVAALVIFGSVGNMLEDARAQERAKRLQQALYDRVPSAKRP